MPRFRDDLEDEASTSSGSDEEQEEADVKPQPKKKKTEQAPSLEDLQQAGFRSGPSILTMKEQPEDVNFEWGTGRSSVADDDEEDFEARERSRAAATHATEAVAKQAAELRRQTALQLEQERQEHAANQHKRRETYQQREKRKRDMGQQKKSKNYVEEEKRLLRQHNVYSGFDN